MPEHVLYGRELPADLGLGLLPLPRERVLLFLLFAQRFIVHTQDAFPSAPGAGVGGAGSVC